MDVIVTDTGAFVISLTDGELTENENGVMTKENTENIVRRALGYDAGLPPMKIELYEGNGEMMLFATIDGAVRLYYVFRDIESLIGCCKSCRGEPESELYLYDGEYILSVSVKKPEDSADFCEFVQNLPCGRLYREFLKEHGKTLIPGDAVKIIKNTF